MTLSVAIATHSMNHGDYFFTRLLESLWVQTFQDFEIIVSDNSDDETIETICKQYKTGIIYFRNPRKGVAKNLNAAIQHSRGDLIKILCMDDFMAHERALQKLISRFDGDWMVSTCTHNETGNNFTHSIHHPYYSQDLKKGVNTIGSISLLTIKNEEPLLFDEKLNWLVDTDYYQRLYDQFGEPQILRDINVVIGLHSDQISNTMSQSEKISEFNYLNKKYHVLA